MKWMKRIGLGVLGLVAAGAIYLFSYLQLRESQSDIVIAYAMFQHETCTFCPSPPTGIEQFEHDFKPLSGLAAEATKAVPIPYIQGFLHGVSMQAGVLAKPAYLVAWPFGGSSASTITREAFDKYTGGIVDNIAAMEKVDGVHLFLHGGMAVEGIPRPEAEIVRRVRVLVGDDIPISATFDHHGNEDEELLKYLDIGLAVKRFPHYDADLQGERAARLLIRSIRGDYTPTSALRKPGVMFATVYGGTHTGAPQDIMERARRWENREQDAFVSVFNGWTFADVPDIGMAVLVVTNNDQELADEIAADMNEYIRSRRADFEYPIPAVSEGVGRGLDAQKADPGKLVLANMSDRMGDSTEIARELRRLGKTDFVIAAIADQDVLDELHENYDEGDAVALNIGGKSSELAGAPLPVEGSLRFLGKPGGLVGKRYATIEAADNTWYILSDYYEQVTTPKLLEDLAVPVDDLSIFVVKSRNHFRRGFMETGFARHSVIIDAPGHGPANISLLDYRNLPEGIYSKYFEAEPDSVAEGAGTGSGADISERGAQ
ncbi:MAG: M81 family metallopeptidase [Pseudomonadota bacterium]